jgi:hypothetical protein
VTIELEVGRTSRSLARSVFTCVSTVRSVLSASSPQTSLSSWSRDQTLPGRRSSA